MPGDDPPQDINALIRGAARQAARSHQETHARATPVLQAQEARREQRATGEHAQPLAAGHDADGAPCWVLQGNAVRDGMVLEVYTNRANGYLRGQVVGRPWPERPHLALTLWDPFGRRDVDGLPPRVGQWEVPIPEGARCRFSAALPSEID